MALVLVITTVATAEDAARLARMAVEEQLAACVQTDVIESCYRWQGQVVQAREWRLLCKTTHAARAALEARLKALHPYEEPALYTLQPADVAPTFAAWVEAEVPPRGADGAS